MLSEVKILIITKLKKTNYKKKAAGKNALPK